MSNNKKDIIKEFWMDRGESIKDVDEEEVYNHTTFRCGNEKHSLEVRELWRSGLINGFTKMLDLGCGTGRLCQYFHEHVYKVVGTDISSGFIYRLNSWAETNKAVNVEFMELDFLEPDFYKRFDSSFSLVLIYGATIYVDDDEDYINILTNVYRITDPDGHLIIKQTTSMEEEDIIVDKQVQEIENSKRYFAHYHTPGRIIELANKAGFKFIKAYPAYNRSEIGDDLYNQIEKWDNTKQVYYYFIRR
jgi:SAM-dependent methyltransferase